MGLGGVEPRSDVHDLLLVLGRALPLRQRELVNVEACDRFRGHLLLEVEVLSLDLNGRLVIRPLDLLLSFHSLGCVLLICFSRVQQLKLELSHLVLGMPDRSVLELPRLHLVPCERSTRFQLFSPFPWVCSVVCDVQC